MEFKKSRNKSLPLDQHHPRPSHTLQTRNEERVGYARVCVWVGEEYHMNELKLRISNERVKPCSDKSHLLKRKC